MKIAVIGGSGGIGSAFVRQLAGRHSVERIYTTYYQNPTSWPDDKVVCHPLDLTREDSIASWTSQFNEIDWLINAVGLLHDHQHGPEKSIKRLDAEFYLRNMQINSLSHLLLAKHTQDKFRHNRPGIFASVSARVGSIEENYLGGWYSYRASKAALNMGIKTLSIEWRRSLPNMAVAALHPGTTDTELSRPFQRNVPPDQLFTPDYSASKMLQILDSLTAADSGKFWSFDGTILPW